MVSELFSDTQTLKAEVRRLRGRLDSILAGNTIIPQPGPGGTLPVPTQGALLVGNSTPVWVRLDLTAPASAVVRNVLAADQGDLEPSWQPALDNTNPTTISAGATASPGTSLIFAHRDHTHGAPSTYPATAHNILSATHGDSTAAAAVRGDIITAQGASPTWSRLAIAVPAANVRNVLGVDNGETEASWKAALDGTAPTTIAAADAAAAGTSLLFSHRDHRHGAPATYPATAHNILSATHGDSTAHAAVAGDIIYADAGPSWTRLPIATDGWVLTLASGLPTWAAAGSSSPHALLDGVQNNDTLAHAPVRGDLIVANSTPLWAHFTVGANGSVLWANGTDPSWTGSPLLSGYLLVGGTAAPLNTTAGDVTSSRQVVGTDILMSDATAGALVQLVNSTFTPAGTIRNMVNWNAITTPNGGNVSFLAGQLRMFVRPSAADSGVGFGVAFTWNHDSGAFNLTNSGHAGLLSTVVQGVGSTTVTGLNAFLGSLSVTAGTVTTLRGFLAQFNNSSTGAAITTLNLYDMTVSTYPTAVTTVRGLNIPNLGAAPATTAIGIDIAAQSGATTNFDIRAAGNTVHGGYMRIGSVSAPANTTAGDLTAVRFNIGNATFSGNGNALLLLTASVTPTDADTFLYYQNTAWTPDGTSTAGRRRVAYNVNMPIEPTAADTATFIGIRLVVNHDAGAFDLSNVTEGVRVTIGQTATANTMGTIQTFSANMTMTSGSITTMRGYYTTFNGTGGTTLSTLNHFEIASVTFPTTLTTHRGMLIPNLGNAAVTTAVGIDITTQSGATTNFDIRAGGNSVYGGYIRAGSVSAPTNTTAGDVTATRLFVPNSSVVNGSVITFTLASTTPAATGYGVYMARVYTPNGGNVANSELLRVEAYSRPTAADTGTVIGLHVFSTHDSAAFNPGSMFGIIAEAKQQVAATTAANVVPFNAQATVSAGDVTTLEGTRVQFILTGGGAISTAILYQMLLSSFPTSITTLIGLNVPNLGNAAVTNAIGIDIAAQSGATANIGIRNAATTVYTPSASQDLVAATAILANASIVKITASAGSVTLTGTPTIADGFNGQVLVITNVGSTTVTLQDQGTLASSNLRLTANTVALAPRQTLILWYSSTVGDWVQMTPVAGVL